MDQHLNQLDVYLGLVACLAVVLCMLAMAIA
jgi:hypothetical protein